jgi:hypothetical protein
MEADKFKEALEAVIGEGMPSSKAVLLVEFFHQSGEDLFICGVTGRVTVRELEKIEVECRSEMSDEFDKGDGSYLFEARWYSGQYGEYGQCELPPGWELSPIAFRSVAAEDATPQPSLTAEPAGEPQPASPPSVSVDEESGATWRRLALQFDGHRMQAMGWLKMVAKELPDIPAWSALRDFIAAPPLDGELVLAERIAAIQRAESTQPAPLTDIPGVVAGEKVCEWIQQPAEVGGYISTCKRHLCSMQSGAFCQYCGNRIVERKS